jgi:hypothetical protein
MAYSASPAVGPEDLLDLTQGITGRRTYSRKPEGLVMKYVRGILKAARTMFIFGLAAASLALNAAVFAGGTLSTAAATLIVSLTGLGPEASLAAPAATRRGPLDALLAETVRPLDSRAMQAAG